MPFIRKEIEGYYDFKTPYGYGDPIANIQNEDWVVYALSEMENLFRKEKYICRFIRFHSLLRNDELCKKRINVLFDRNTIAINTLESEEQIWRG